MKNIILKLIAIATVSTAMLIFAGVTGVVETPQVFAQATCGACEDDPVDPGDPGGGGGGEEEPNPPSCELSTSLEYVNPGEQYVISWTGTSNASYAFVNNSESLSVGHTGTYTFTWDAEDALQFFEIQGTNADGTCSDSVTVYRQVDAPTCDISTSIAVAQDGEEFTISWSGTPDHSTAFRVNGTLVDAVDSASYTWPANRTDPIVFTMTGDNVAGDCSESVTVEHSSTVTPTTPDISIIKRDNADKDDTQQVAIGGTATFEIVVTNTGGEALKNVVVTDPLEPNCDRTIGNLAIGASDTYTCTSSNIQEAFTNVASVTGESVVDDQVVNDSDPTNVTVPTTTGITCAANVSFTASDTSLPRGGGSVTLTWSTTGLDTVSISGVASSNLSDSEVVDVTTDTTYTLTGAANGQVINCPLTIDVATGGGGGGGSNNPRCKYFEASDETVAAGERVTLRWATSRTEEITLYEGTMRNGDEIFNTDDDDDVDEGEFVVRPTKDTTYTLLLERGSRDRTCDVEIEVEDNVIVLSDREQEPRVAGIALTQVPYTGFEAGPALTIFFYILLALWGLFVAYTFAVKRDSILGFSLSGALPRKQSVIDASVEVATESEEEVTRVAEYVAQATAAPANLPTGNAPIIGYAAQAAAPAVATIEDDEVTDDVVDEALTDLENRAHAQNALLSSDAMRYFADTYSAEEQFAALDALISDAKRTYPSEDGWVVINLERMQSLMDVTDVVRDLDTAPVTTGSLAEAIVTVNVAAAFELIGNRPMVALADATTDLDALYRLRTGGEAQVSDLLVSESSHLRDEQITDALNALTSALDGTYSDEKEAVRTAVMKSIKAVS